MDIHFFGITIDLGNMTGSFVKSASDMWQCFNWPEAEQSYREHLIHLYGKLRILGNPTLVPLAGVFTDVYVLDKPSAWRRFGIAEMECDRDNAYESGMERQKGLDFVKPKPANSHNQENKNNLLFILGKPGAGKTTFLKYLTVQAAQRKLAAIPIFVSLKEWSDSQLELFDFMVKQFKICQFPDARKFIELILQQGKAMVLFDGLDEVPQENLRRAEIISRVQDFSKQYLVNQCLITSRMIDSSLSFDLYTYVEVADFSEGQIESYVRKWFSGEKSSKQQLFLDEFKKSEHKGLRELARTPLLLSLLCLVFEGSLHFPDRHADIYDEALDMLLRKWDSSRSIQRDEIHKGLSLKRKHQLFARVANETFKQGKYFIKEDFLVKQIETFLRKLPPLPSDSDAPLAELDGSTILKGIEARYGIFVERAHKIYSFSHLSFQEYFTSKYIAENPKEIKVLMQHCTDSRWREVFLLTASLLDEDHADEFFAEFQQTMVRLGREDQTLMSLLNWTRNQAQKNQSFCQTGGAVRSMYVFLALALNPERTFSLDRRRLILDRSIALASVLSKSAPSFGRALAFDRSLAFTFDNEIARLPSPNKYYYTCEDFLALDRIFFREFAHDIDLARVEACKLNFFDLTRARAEAFAAREDLPIDIKSDFLLVHVLSLVQTLSRIDHNQYQKSRYVVVPKLIAFINQVIDITSKKNSLHTELQDLTLPNENDRQPVWHEFANRLRSLMQQHQDIGYDWNLTEKQTGKLASYFEANHLLIECLGLAMVSNRKAIEDKILLLE